MKHASIIPLIGGSTIATSQFFGTNPEYMATFSPFHPNETHLTNYYPEVPYYTLDDNKPSLPYVDVISTICPCAGLSSLSIDSSATKEINNWMYTTSEYILSELKPRVFWGENAPRLGSNAGRPVVDNLAKIAQKHGYTLTIYRTKSIMHGLSQIRDRAFYVFWKGNDTPLLDFFNRDYKKIEDTITDSTNETMSQLTNDKLPTDNPYYEYVLEDIYGGISHTEFMKNLKKTTNPLTLIEKESSFLEASEWMKKQKYEKEHKKCLYIQGKLDNNRNYMKKTTELPKDYIGAFVGHNLFMTAHPEENRYLTYREALDIMTMPEDFELIEPRKNINHLAQNVPVSTAKDIISSINNCLISNNVERMNAGLVYQNNKNGINAIG